MANCNTCGNAIFDELWGDFKCSVYKHTVYSYRHEDCKDYKEGTPKPSKNNQCEES